MVASSIQLGTGIVVGKKFLAEQAATLLKFAKATTNPDVAAGLLDKAAEIAARGQQAPDLSPRAPDVEQADVQEPVPPKPKD